MYPLKMLFQISYRFPFLHLFNFLLGVTKESVKEQSICCPLSVVR
jgi:hypothetical protein